MKPERLNELVTLYEGDNRELALPPDDYAAVISDPPYGMNWDTDSKRYSGGNRALRRGEGRDDWPEIHGDAVPFDPSPWLEYPKVVLWGANHFAAKLPVGTTLVWLKKDDHLFGTFLSDAEIGWMKGGYGVYVFRKQFPPPSRIVEGGGECLHPTQKPIGLMRWCIQRLKLPAGAHILDPFAGSGTTAIAAMIEGRRCTLVEKDPAYCDIIRKRVAAETAKHSRTLFGDLTTATTPDLFAEEE